MSVSNHYVCKVSTLNLLLAIELPSYVNNNINEAVLITTVSIGLVILLLLISPLCHLDDIVMAVSGLYIYIYMRVASIMSKVG